MITTVNIQKFLKTKGYSTVSEDWYKHIDLWEQWYKGKTAFHKYTICNMGQVKSYTRKTLGMAKKVAEDQADLLLNEKVEILASEQTAQDIIDDVLFNNNFWVKGNQLVEQFAALGCGATVVYKEGEEVLIDYIDAKCIYPIKWRKRGITECAFASEAEDGNTFISLHKKENGLYVIYNYLVRQDSTGAIEELALPDDIALVWQTNSETPTFQIYSLNIANNVMPGVPLGVSIYANCIDVLQSTDIVYDSYANEFILGKKRIMANSNAFNVNIDSGTAHPVFDPSDTVYYDMGENDGNSPIKEIDFSLRCEEHQIALQNNLDLLSEKCGFGKGYYNFNADNVQTATAVVSQNSQLFRKIKKHEIIIEKNLIDLARIILKLSGYNKEAEISIQFDDSIIEDTNAVANRALLELNSGAIDLVMYYMITRGMDEDTAIADVAKMQSRQMPVDIGEEGAQVDAGQVVEDASQAVGRQLNGAQTQSLLSVIERFTSGQLSEGQAVNIISASIGVTTTEAQKLLSGAM